MCYSKTPKRKIRNEFLRQIMLRAWHYYKTENYSFSVSLKNAWKWIRTKKAQKKLSKVQIPIF